MSNVQVLERATWAAFKPPKRLSLSEWADNYAYLSAESSAEGGRWHTLPYQKGIMDAITDPRIEQVTLMKSARVGYSKILNHVIGYHIHQDPCPVMLVQPTIEDAQGYSKEEIAPMLRDTPCLRGVVSDAKAKDGANTILQKQFPGGSLSLVGANSPRGFRRVSRRVVLFDEVDGYPPSAGTEGDQIKLGIRRTEYYWNRKIVAGSTPTIKDFSRVERMFQQGDQRRYFVPCPDCGHMQYLRWSNIKWRDNDPDTASYCCESCGVWIPHTKKRWMVERGEWRPTAPGKPTGKHISFHIWAAYSYSPNATWPNLVEEFLEAKADAEQLKTFVNTVLGETWEDEYASKIGADALSQRAGKEEYKHTVPPTQVLALTMGCDVQADRLSLSVWGWGRDEEAYLVDRVKLYGDPTRPEVWAQLDQILQTPYKGEDGLDRRVQCAAIDSGFNAHVVYQYAKERQQLGVIAIKGMSTKGKPPLGKATKVDVNSKGRTVKRGAQVFPVGSDTVKSLLFARLKHNDPGPGYLHFYPTTPLDYFEELTAEKQILRFRNGFPERHWVKKPTVRNEAVDELVYAYAALHRLYQVYDKRTIWDQLERKYDTPGKEHVPEKRQIAAPRRSFVNQW
jgi:phage terminase large subunit GpA-like protein